VVDVAQLKRILSARTISVRDFPFLEELSRRYPQLSSVNVTDGLDDRERTILASEGTALVKELQGLILKGEMRHGR
jgi:hypothetical protein